MREGRDVPHRVLARADHGLARAYRSHGEKPTDIDFAAFNEKFHAECSDLDLHDVRVMSGASRHRMREEVSRIDDDISQGWMRLIATCLHEHYAEHIPDLDAFLGRTA